MQKICEIFILCIALNLLWNFRMCCNGNGLDSIVVANSASTTTETPKWMLMMKSKQQRSSHDSLPVVLQGTKDLINRSTGNGNSQVLYLNIPRQQFWCTSFSQVLSLNITNLLIIALLKILVFAAGIIGANHFKHYGRHQEPSHYGELLLHLFSCFFDGDSFLVEGIKFVEGYVRCFSDVNKVICVFECCWTGWCPLIRHGWEDFDWRWIVWLV